jgi:alpha-tubulin suppressor-like RCC1 family protein
LFKIVNDSISPEMEVGAGLHHNCAINTDAIVSCWSTNLIGQLGNGTNVDSLSATLVKELEGAHALAVGANHTCILSGTNNIAMCRGENTFGQLGNDSMTPSNPPVFVIMPAIQ